MRITNEQVEAVMMALSSVMTGVMLPVAEACGCAEVIVALDDAHKKIMLVETPIFNGRQNINSTDDPAAISRLNEFRAIECAVDIPIFPIHVIASAGGKANPVHLAMLLRVGIVTTDRATPEEE